MALYFRTWKMAVAGLVALLHDLFITVGIYALSGFEVTPSSMIGFLTILGYSLYDTVVVFDKVRENTAEAFVTRRVTYTQAANLAVNQTLVRSINTTVVALLPIAAILVVGFTLLGPGTLLDLASPCSSVSRSAPTPRSSSPRRCWSTCAGTSRPSRSSTRRRCASSPARRCRPATASAGRRARPPAGGRAGDAPRGDTARRRSPTSGPRRRARSTSGPAAAPATSRVGPQVEALTMPEGSVTELVLEPDPRHPRLPEAGVLFKDFTPLLADGEASRRSSTTSPVGMRVGRRRRRDRGAAGSSRRGRRHRLGLGFVPVRKSGKLPGPSLREEYTLSTVPPSSRCTRAPSARAAGARRRRRPGHRWDRRRHLSPGRTRRSDSDRHRRRSRADLPRRSREGRRPAAVRHRAALTRAAPRAAGGLVVPTRLST